MNNKKIVISCGPIPARLDSVKFITNRFKGGLAFKTAKELIVSNYNVTIIKWVGTSLPIDSTDDCWSRDNVSIVDVNDVFEYYNWYENNACNYSAFIMAAAVANLAPSNPYSGKFPSHNYKVGEKFNIEFEIAPRAIDIIKQKNKRCCLIGYKLFDAQSDEELIEIARHTLHDSKANIIFANTPSTAKTKKIAVFQDNTVLEMSFDRHIELIKEAIDSVYFKTCIIDEPIDKQNRIELAKLAVKDFEQTVSDIGFGTIAIKVSDDGDFVTTSRGHSGEPVYVKNIVVDSNTQEYVVYATGKATLNTPILFAYIKDYDYVIHKHTTLSECVKSVDNINCQYIFPGTLKEYEMYDNLSGNKSVYEKGHGYLIGYKYLDMDWSNYFNLFPKHYFKSNKDIDYLMSQVYDKEDILEVGCNISTEAGYFIDPNIKEISGSTKLEYSNIGKNGKKFKLIVLKSSINYLSHNELVTLIDSLQKDGQIVANTFVNSPETRSKYYDDGTIEYVFKEFNIIHHFLYNSDREVYYHKFYATNVEVLEQLGFELNYYGNNSVLAIYTIK